MSMLACALHHDHQQQLELGSVMRRLALSVLAMVPFAASAVPITYDFTGFGLACVRGVACAEETDFTGSVVIDVVDPNGFDVTGDVFRQGIGSWVTMTASLQWAGGAFETLPPPAYEVSSAQDALLVNWDVLGQQTLTLRHDVATYNNLLQMQATHYTSLQFETFYGGLLTGLDFPEPFVFDPGLFSTPGFGAVLQFNTNVPQYENGVLSGSTGINGSVSLNSWTVRPDHPTSVPEPGSLALFGFGVMGLALARRRAGVAAR